MINDISVYYPFRSQPKEPIHKHTSKRFCSTPASPDPHPLHQKIDSWVIVVSSSSAFIPFTELPLLLRRGLHTATE